MYNIFKIKYDKRKKCWKIRKYDSIYKVFILNWNVNLKKLGNFFFLIWFKGIY